MNGNYYKNGIKNMSINEVQLRVPRTIVDSTRKYGSNWTCLEKDKHTKVTSDDKWYYYTTNYDFIIDDDLEGVLEYLLNNK